MLTVLTWPIVAGYRASSFFRSAKFILSSLAGTSVWENRVALTNSNASNSYDAACSKSASTPENEVIWGFAVSWVWVGDAILSHHPMTAIATMTKRQMRATVSTFGM